jgi:Adenylate and Guanylate cyclase catalytic domain
VMGDGIMALFGAPLAHEDHAVRACYAALRMQSSVKRYAEVVQRAAGVPIQIRVGLNSGEVVVRSIGNDLHMDYTAVGQTTHLTAHGADGHAGVDPHHRRDPRTGRGLCGGRAARTGRNQRSASAGECVRSPGRRAGPNAAAGVSGPGVLPLRGS